MTLLSLVASLELAAEGSLRRLGAIPDTSINAQNLDRSSRNTRSTLGPDESRPMPKPVRSIISAVAVQPCKTLTGLRLQFQRNSFSPLTLRQLPHYSISSADSPTPLILRLALSSTSIQRELAYPSSSTLP